MAEGNGLMGRPNDEEGGEHNVCCLLPSFIQRQAKILHYIVVVLTVVQLIFEKG